MKIFKNILTTIILLSTLTTSILTASTSNEIEINYCSEDLQTTVLTLEIPDAGVNIDIELLQSTFDAIVTIELESENGLVIIDIDGMAGLIRGDGINARIDGDGINDLIIGDGINARIDGDGINDLIRGDGINARIDGDGINDLIRGDGINARVTVSQLGTVLFSDEL